MAISTKAHPLLQPMTTPDEMKAALKGKGDIQSDDALYYLEAWEQRNNNDYYLDLIVRLMSPFVFKPEIQGGRELPFWRFREAIRFRHENVYKKIELFETDFYALLRRNPYFVHLPQKFDEKNPVVSFTPSAEYGERDRRVVTKMGKFLNKYYKDDLTEDKIREIATEFNSGTIPYTLHLAETSEEIERVYKACTTDSCMSKERDFWSLLYEHSLHPTHVYESPDIALAYVKAPDDRIVARTLINKVNQTYVRIYGHETAMEYLLKKEMNIHYRGDLQGTRIKRIKVKDNLYVAPYLDGDATYIKPIANDKEFFLVTTSSRGAYNHPNYQRAYFEIEEPCPRCEQHGGRRLNSTYTVINDHSNSTLVCRNCIAAENFKPVAHIVTRGRYTARAELTSNYIDTNLAYDEDRFRIVTDNATRAVFIDMVEDPNASSCIVSDHFDPSQYLLKATDKTWIIYNAETQTSEIVYSNKERIHEKQVVARIAEKQVLARVMDEDLEQLLESGEVVKASIGRYKYLSAELARRAVYRVDGHRTIKRIDQCLFDITNATWISQNLFYEHCDYRTTNRREVPMSILSDDTRLRQWLINYPDVPDNREDHFAINTISDSFLHGRETPWAVNDVEPLETETEEELIEEV